MINSDDKYEAILELCRDMNSESDLPSFLNSVAAESARILGAEKASIFLLDKEKQELWSIVTLDGKEIRFDARLGISGASAMTGKTINVKDVSEDSRFYRRVDTHTKYRTKSILVTPLKIEGGEIVGTFQVLNKKKGSFSRSDKTIIELLAEQVSSALKMVQLLENLRSDRNRLKEINTSLGKEIRDRFSTQNIIGSSPRMQGIVRMIEQISDAPVNVLITGESGTGKELVAKAIHYGSSRSDKPFVALNSAALPESLVESELFGIEKGAATGVAMRIGKFEEASGGTLFLDEIGDLNPSSQSKILRVLQERVMMRVGGRRSIPVDVRIIAATNKDLEAEIKKGDFRDDLYYRLKVVHIEMPPLRSIPEDIPLLTNYFLVKHTNEMNRGPKKISPDATELFLNYDWRGNVRELENQIKRLVVLVPGKVIKAKDLSPEIRMRGTEREYESKGSLDLKMRVAELEKNMINEALAMSNYNRSRAAGLLGLSRYGLLKKMKRYNIG